MSMSQSVHSGRPVPGTSLRTLGGIALAVSVVVALWRALQGDYVTAVAVLLYVPAGLLLYRIGRDAERA